MARIAFVADPHVGNHRRFGGAVEASINERCQLTLDTLAAAYDHAMERECDALVVCGDLFDTARPPPQLVAEVERALTPQQRPETAPPMDVHLLVGNHELVSDDVGDHALASLALVPGIYVHETPGVVKLDRGSVRLLCVPYRSGNASAWLPKVVDQYVERDKKVKHRLLAMHLGISDDKTSKFLRGAHDSVEAELLADLCYLHGIGHVFAGNWHDRRSWQMAWPNQEGKAKLNHVLKILQLGALCPTGFDNAGLSGYGTVAVWESSSKVTLTEISGPRFVQLAEDEELRDDMVPAGCRVFTEVKVDTAEVRAAARAAAHVARGADTLQEALGAFVAKMPLDEGVDRDAVLAAAKEYLAQ